ncbi:hypothetical protein EJ419_07820 [Alloscardovia theropitheci]|uniref:Methyltransferase n=1 Tax=Alloscardovia theropitheci TaxID=2496842 RepID=A0A4R0QRA0_9BIFI|nr:hypothetical protein [Alloscardovia theropitheci]TCD53545.1 hypothetical protein EJ419_07820 [Alloscardovia theropitheci]
MNSTTYSQISKAWQFIEESSNDDQSSLSRSIYNEAVKNSHTHSIISSSQAQFLHLQAQLINARTVLLVGTETGLEIPALVSGMNNEGQMTVVNNSSEDANRTRNIFNALPDTHTKMRCVHTDTDTFLARLNAHDYDMIIVSGDPQNYRSAFNHSERLLRSNGLLILTDAMAMRNQDSHGGVPDAADRSEKAVALRTILDELSRNDSFDYSLVAIATGMILAVTK